MRLISRGLPFFFRRIEAEQRPRRTWRVVTSFADLPPVFPAAEFALRARVSCTVLSRLGIIGTGK